MVEPEHVYNINASHNDVSVFAVSLVSFPDPHTSVGSGHETTVAAYNDW